MAAPTLTAYTDINPWVEVFLSGGDVAVGTVRLRYYRYSEDRVWLVRGGVDVAPGVAALDFECPFQTQATYRAEQFDATGVSLGFTDAASITLSVSDVWVHNPLVPTGGVSFGSYGLKDGSFDGTSRPTVGEVVYPEGAVVGHRIGSARRGLVSQSVGLAVDSLEQADALQAMLGTYTTAQIGVLCIRTPPGVRVPRTFFAAVRDPQEVDINVNWGGGERTDFWFTADEVAPPFSGLVVPLLTYDDLDVAYATYALRDAAYATYTEQDRDYSLAGLADQ